MGNSPAEMLSWQYRKLIGELQQVQLHAEDPSCPCGLRDIGEFCLPKHSLNVETIAAETAAMDSHNSELLYELQESAIKTHDLLKSHVCGKGKDADIVAWARDWRKKIEPIYYACKAKLHDSADLEAKPKKDSGGPPVWCSGVESVARQIDRLAKSLLRTKAQMSTVRGNLTTALNICAGQAQLMAAAPISVLDPHGSRCRDPKTGLWTKSKTCGFEPVGNRTVAFGADGMTRYEFEFRIIDLDTAVVSHDPFTFTLNPAFPAELQPRMRTRKATQVQVEKIAAHLEPDNVLMDFHVLDRGTPIVGSDLVVEAGNGRVMAIKRAAKDHQERYAAYKRRLTERVRDYGLRAEDVKSVEQPLLVRVRLSNVDRVRFAQETNAMPTIATSAIENAKTDSERITLDMLQSLDIGENESLADALRAPKNQPFARRFLATLPDETQAALVDAQGYLNLDGVHRMAMAVFVSAFQGDAGLRLAEKAFEVVDDDIRTAVNAIGRSLGSLAQAEALIKRGQRDAGLSIADDLAQTLVVYSAIKNNPALTVEKYLAQGQLTVNRELTSFEERILKTLHDNRRSAKRLGEILRAYAQSVIDQPPPSQAGMFGGAPVTKEELWEMATHAQSERPVEKAAALAATMTKREWREAMKYQIPFDGGSTCPPNCPVIPEQGKRAKYELFPFQKEGVEWLKSRTTALLADEMGLGKTPQAIMWASGHRPALVIVPAALVLNWEREIASMWRPDDSVIILDGQTPLPETLPDWTLLTYGMVKRYLSSLKRAGFESIIIDEAHLVKNLTTQRTKAVLELVEPRDLQPTDRPIPFRLAVTGTPILNRPIELFPLLVFLGVEKRAKFQDFLRNYTEYKVVRGRMMFTGARNLSQLNSLLKGIMLRRLKKDVLKDLPPKTNTPMFVPISNADEYQAAERNFLSWLKDRKGDEAAWAASKAEVITKMNALRQLAALGKVEPVADWLKPCSNGQGKTIVFSSFKEPLQKLAAIKGRTQVYTGELPKEQRQDLVDRFQRTRDLCYFMGTVGAAGVGITLTAASRVAFMDLPWTPGGKIQAEDRAHRIGQQQPVQVVNVLARGTIDERMLQLLSAKEFIISQAVDGKTRQEAQESSVANALIESYMRQPASLSAPVKYVPDEMDEDLNSVESEKLEILQGLNDSMTDIVAAKLEPCNVEREEIERVLSWKPLRDMIASWVGHGETKSASLCSIGMVAGVYQLTFRGVKDPEKMHTWQKRLFPQAKRVHSAVPGEMVYELVLPQEARELTWTPQEVGVGGRYRREKVEQAAMFAPKRSLCTPEQAQKLERCIQDIKERNRAAGQPAEGTGTRGAPNPFAVCQKSVGCRKDAARIDKLAQALVADRGRFRESGHTICQQGTKLLAGPHADGDYHSVSVPVSCPAGAKPVAIYHTHPSGHLEPSELDLKASQRFGLPVCIGTTDGSDKISCHQG